jgi:Eukaryotic aspartyl protease
MEDLPHIPASGLFGLNIGADHGINPIVDTLRMQKKITQTIFSMFLSVDMTSYLIIGGTDPEFMSEKEF